MANGPAVNPLGRRHFGALIHDTYTWCKGGQRAIGAVWG